MKLGAQCNADKATASRNASRPDAQRTDIWYCGPNGLAAALKTGLGKGWGRQLRFHQEAFELR